MVHHLIYEVNARLLTRRMCERFERRLTLSAIPAEYWTDLARRFQHVWLMGAWERSAASRAEALRHDGLRGAYSMALPDWSEEDVDGSPYAVRAYRLDPALGDASELAVVRKQVNRSGMGLILDFVPNHVARDHPWTREHPEYFVRPREEALARHPEWFFRTPEGTGLAHGRDPYFPPWTDTAQLDFTSRGLRQALIEELRTIAEVSDGVRCDMAMLALNDVHADVWGTVRPGMALEDEFWSEAIARVRMEHPHFLFIAEAYWGTEPRLVELGFDYVYDKELYDALRHGSEALLQHLSMDRLGAHALRFIENHDEARAAAVFGREQGLAAAAVAATLPGAFLVHDGQIEGRRARLPVQLTREPEESIDEERAARYDALLRAVNGPPIGAGSWHRLPVEPLEDDGPPAILAWRWDGEPAPCVVVVNYAHEGAGGRIDLGDPLPRSSRFRDRFPPPPGSSVREPQVIEVALGRWEVRLLDAPPAEGGETTGSR